MVLYLDSRTVDSYKLTYLEAMINCTDPCTKHGKVLIVILLVLSDKLIIHITQPLRTWDITSEPLRRAVVERQEDIKR